MTTALIRVQTPEGQLRVSLKKSATSRDLYNEVQSKFAVAGKPWQLHTSRPRCSSNAIQRKPSRHGLAHGAQIYLFFGEGISNVAAESSGDCSTSIQEATEGVSESTSNTQIRSTVKEDDIDLELWKEDSNVAAAVQGAKTMRITDLVPNPWDQKYLESKGLKLTSFHAHMRKLHSGIDKGKFAKLSHVPLSVPKSSESKLDLSALPNSVTLKPQPYRHVDKIVFENGRIANDFINFWRHSNSQRIGFLYGTYEKTNQTEIPLGLEAKICAIYEPPQKNASNKVTLEDSPEIQKIDTMASLCGLTRVGWLLSDLVALDPKEGTVKELRKAETHFVSAEELITAASFQLQHPNPCRMSESGYFGSKFVTVICSGGTDNQIGFNGYQASNQCMDLVRGRVIIPTLDAPELAFCKDSDDELLIPEVFYSGKDEYGNEVKKEAKPMPVEYLISDMNVTMPKEASYSWSSETEEHDFPIENRTLLGDREQVQDLNALAKYLRSYSGDGISTAILQKDFNKIFSNFHMLVWLTCEENLPACGCEGVTDIIQNLREGTPATIKQLLTNESWQTLLEICREANSFGQMDDLEMDDDISEAIKRSLQER